jgi:lipopolysaccharide heptosyltransferase II
MNSPDMQKILIINTFGIGDVLFTTPMVRNLKTSLPGVSISYIGNRRTAPILERHPDIDRVFVYERDEFYAIYKKSKLEYFKHGRAFLRDIKNEKFDCVFDLSLQGSFGFFMWLIGIPRRIGFNYKNRNPFLTQKIPFKGYENKPVVEYYLDLLESMGVKSEHKYMSIPISTEERTWAKNILQQQCLAQRNPLIALVPGGGASWGNDSKYKRWGTENYAKLADKIIEKSHAAIILMGDNKEEDLCAQVVRLMKTRPFNLCGQTTIGQMAAVFQQCQMAIVNDGGPLHIAVAAGTKTVSIFGPVDDQVYGPYPPESHLTITKKIACRPCYRRFRRAQCDHVSCLTTLSVDEVFRKVEGVL